MEPRPFTVGEIVAYNFKEARNLRGWTLEKTAAELAPYVGAHWTKGNVSALERSMANGSRRFDADDLLAFARGFDLPLSWFFIPPPYASAIIGADSGRKRGQEARQPVEQTPMAPSELLTRVIPIENEYQAALISRIEKLPEDIRVPAIEVLSRFADMLIAEEVGAREHIEVTLRGLAERFSEGRLRALQGLHLRRAGFGGFAPLAQGEAAIEERGEEL